MRNMLYNHIIKVKDSLSLFEYEAMLTKIVPEVKECYLLYIICPEAQTLFLSTSNRLILFCELLNVIFSTTSHSSLSRLP